MLNEADTIESTKLSIIVPMCNEEDSIDLLKVKLLSLQDRICATYDVEYCLIDDGSTDNTLKVLEEFKDPRIFVVASPENLGQSSQLNKGISLAKGEFIAMAHADDINLPTRFSAQLEHFARHPEVGVGDAPLHRDDVS